MIQKDNIIQFELKKALSFMSGEGISEMISITLDPDIVIQKEGQYVQLRGVALLRGEYLIQDEKKETESTRIPSSSIKVHKVDLLGENKLAVFTHRFPIDISVSHERIKDLNEVSIIVDSFDYELPASNLLNIYANLHILGIEAEKNLTEKHKEEELEGDQFISKLAEDEEIQLETESLFEDKSSDSLQEIDLRKRDDHKAEQNKAKEKKGPTTMPHIEDKEKPSLELVEEKLEKKPSHHVSSEVNQSAEQKESDELTEEADMKQEDEEKQVKNEESVETSFLSTLFKEKKETFMTLKMYIAQKDDTLESIAKKYEVPVLQLLKENNLGTESIEEGQPLKIKLILQEEQLEPNE